MQLRSECEFCEHCVESKCTIGDDCLAIGHSYCHNFLGTKMGDIFYRYGEMVSESYTFSEGAGKIQATFSVGRRRYVFYEVNTQNIQILHTLGLSEVYLLEIQPRAGFNGSVINIVNHVFMPLEKIEENKIYELLENQK